MKTLNITKKMAAYSLEEFKKLYNHAYPEKTNGYVVTVIHNNMFKSKWVLDKQTALKMIA